jgi:hypothetical protein
MGKIFVCLTPMRKPGTLLCSDGHDLLNHDSCQCVVVDKREKWSDFGLIIRFCYFLGGLEALPGGRISFALRAYLSFTGNS